MSDFENFNQQMIEQFRANGRKDAAAFLRERASP